MTTTLKAWPADDLRFNTSRGSRWYRDTLPACPLAPGANPDEPLEVPAWTTVANAWPKFLTRWAATQAARCAVDKFSEWKLIESDDGYDAAVAWIADESNRYRDAAAVRGTAIHTLLEQVAAGREPSVALFPEAAPFVPAMRLFVEECQPYWIASEIVSFNRRIGIAGTADWFGGLGAIPELGVRVGDFKTKADKGKPPGCYPDHALQVAHHGNADYLIANVDGAPTRVEVPNVEGGLVVVITERGYWVYPTETGEVAYEGVVILRRMWDLTRTAQKLVGKPHAPDCLPTVDLLAERAWLVERLTWLKAEHPDVLATVAGQWPLGVPTLKASNGHSADDLTLIRRIVEQCEAAHRVPFREERVVDEPTQPPAAETAAAPEVPVPPSGAAASLATRRDCDDVIARLRALPADLLATVNAANKASVQPVPNLEGDNVTVAHLDALEHVLAPAEVEHAQRKRYAHDHLRGAVADDADMARAIIDAVGVTTVDQLLQGQADTLACVCIAVATDLIVLVPDTNGVWTLRPGKADDAYLVELCGSKSKAVELAREVAPLLQRPVPRSAAEVAADPLVCAVVAARASAMVAA